MRKKIMRQVNELMMQDIGKRSSTVGELERRAKSIIKNRGGGDFYKGFLRAIVMLRERDLLKEAIGMPPTEAQIKFAVKLYKFRNEMRRQPCASVEWYAYLLTSNAMYNTSNVGELLSLPRVRELLDWWQNGSKIITPKKAEQIVKLLRTKLPLLGTPSNSVKKLEKGSALLGGESEFKIGKEG